MFTFVPDGFGVSVCAGVVGGGRRVGCGGCGRSWAGGCGRLWVVWPRPGWLALLGWWSVGVGQRLSGRVGGVDEIGGGVSAACALPGWETGVGAAPGVGLAGGGGGGGGGGG